MNKYFILYEQALELKELGFNEECLGYYYTDPNAATIPFLCIYKPYKNEFCLHAPLYQQAFRWFRQKYGLYSHIDYDEVIKFNIYFIKGNGFEELYDTYEEAELACLKKLIEIVKAE